VDSTAGGQIGTSDLILAVLARVMFAVIVVWVSVSGTPGGWAPWQRWVAFGVPALVFAVVIFREQIRLSRFASRVDERHPDMLRRYRLLARRSWLTADVGSLARMARDEAIVSDPLLTSEASSVRLLSKVQWVLFWTVMIIVAAAVTLLLFGLF
jgi:hypothetical protein